MYHTCLRDNGERGHHASRAVERRLAGKHCLGVQLYYPTLTSTQKPQDEVNIEEASEVDDKKRARRLVRKMDLHILPLCAWI